MLKLLTKVKLLLMAVMVLLLIQDLVYMKPLMMKLGQFT